MVEYTMTLGDIERGMDHVETGSVYNTTVTAVAESKSSRGWFWKLCVVLLVVAFSATTALIFAWNQHGRKTTIQDTMESHKLKVSGAEDVPLKLKQIGDQAKAAIHVEGEYSRDVLDDSLQWRLDEGQAFSQGMLELKGNQIVIPHTGLYFVYSQASFRVKCHDSGNQAVTVSHIISRYSESMGTKANLLSGLRSICRRRSWDSEFHKSEGWYSSVYVGGAFQLNEGDKLWTETNQLKYVEPEQGKNFFGVFAL